MEKNEHVAVKSKLLPVLTDPNKNHIKENSGEELLNDVAVSLEPECEAPKCQLWIVFFSCCIIHFMVFGMHYSFGAMFPNLLEKFHAGQGQTAWVGSLASGSLFLWSMLSVKLCDMTSVTFTCLFGSIIGGLGLILTSTVKKFEYLYITHSFLFGLGTSLMYTPSLIIIARWFGRWRSAATGFVVACGSLGQVVLSPLLQYFMGTYGVMFTFRWWGSIFAVTAVLSSLSFYLLDKKTRVNLAKDKIAKYSIKWRLWKEKAYVIWICIMMMANFTYYIPLIHLSNYAEQLGASAQTSSLLLTAIAASSMVGRMCFGKISNYKPDMTMPVYQFAMFCTGVVTLFASMADRFWQLLLYAIIYGFLDGSFIGLISIVTMQIVGLEDLAQGWGMMLVSISVPVALGPPTVGWMNENNSVNGRALFYLSGVPMVAGACMMFLIRKWKKTENNKCPRRLSAEEDSSVMLQVVTVL